MSKTIVVISTLVDSTIREYQPDVSFIIFQSLSDLGDYIERTPIRADELYFTRDTIPHVNTSLAYIVSLLRNPFLRVDEVHYITEENSEELPSVEYLIDQEGLTNWEVIKGSLNREFVDGIVNGTGRKEEDQFKRKVVYRVPKSEYIKEHLNKEELDEEYQDDEKYLENIPDEPTVQEYIPSRKSCCKVKHVVGFDSDERTGITFLLAQYVSSIGKTLILERDIEYHRLTEFVTKSKVDCLCIDMVEFIDNVDEKLNVIRNTKHKLICLTCIDRIKYSYTFIMNILYNNLMTDVNTIIEENDFKELLPNTDTIVVIPATVIGALRACQELEPSMVHNVNFVGVNFGYFPETVIKDSCALSNIIADVLSIQKPKSTIFNVKTLTLKGGTNNYDIGSILNLGGEK